MLGRLSPWQQLGSVLLLVAAMVVLTVRTVPATAFYERYLPWIIARSVGLTALVLLTVLVSLGILLSHPLNRSTWRQTKELLVWHRYLSVFVLALIAVHVLAIVLDKYAHVSIVGALVPGLAGYRVLPVALGTVALYAFLITASSASYAQKLPPKLWMGIHRWALVIFALAWTHGVLAGADSASLRTLYLFLIAIVAASAAVRYWVLQQKSPPQSPKGDTTT